MGYDITPHTLYPSFNAFQANMSLASQGTVSNLQIGRSTSI